MRAKDRGPARREPPPPCACPGRYPSCPMRIAYVVGARPNFVKMAPVISDRSQIGQHRRIPGGRHALIHTGQHYDRLMSDIFLEELGVPAPDHMLPSWKPTRWSLPFVF